MMISPQMSDIPMIPAPLAERCDAIFLSGKLFEMCDFDTCRYPLKRLSLAGSQNIVDRLLSAKAVDSSLK